MSRLAERIARAKEMLHELERQKNITVVVAPFARTERPQEPHNATRIDDHHDDHAMVPARDARAGDDPRGC